MPALEWLDPIFARSLVCDENLSVPKLTDYLLQSYPDQKGISLRNVERFLAENNIHRLSFVPNSALDGAVAAASARVGGTCGRKMIKGFLSSEGIIASEHRVQSSLKRVAPYYHENRRRGIQNQLNPQPYYAPYFGYNLHMDQNEKLVDYGVVFVLCIDGMSGFVPSAAVMPRKNNIVIYKDVYCPAVSTYGLWDCVNCDHGREFFLTQFVQHYLSDHRVRTGEQPSQRPPYKQMQSTKNNRVERIWCEVNPRVGFPLKYALIDMENRHIVDKQIPSHLFAMSQVTMAVAEVGLRYCLQSWNNHPIPYRGAPISQVNNRKNYECPVLPDANEAVALYQQSGGNLTEESVVGQDLLHGHNELQLERSDSFWRQIAEEHNTNRDKTSAAEALFGFVSNHNYTPLQDAIVKFINLTQDLYTHLQH